MCQQLAHHTSNGCRVWRYDGFWNYFGPTEDSFGSMLELTWGGKIHKMSDGTERKFINDNTVIMKGYCQNGQVRIGFGEVSSKLFLL
jgi:fumarylacetoacetase